VPKLTANLSLRAKILAAVLTALFITTILISGTQLYIVYQNNEYDAKTMVQNQTGQLAGQISLWLTSVQNLGRALADRPVLKYGTFAEKQQLLATYHASMPGCEAFVLLDQNGTIINRYPYDAGRIGTSNADRDYYKKVIASGEPQFGEIVISRATGKPITVVAYPVKNEQNQIMAVLIQTLDFDYIQNLLKEIKIGKNGISTIIDANGTMIYHSIDSAIGKPAPAVLVNQLNNNIHDVALYKSSLGWDCYGTIADIDGTPWHVGIALPYSEVMHTFFTSFKAGLLVLAVVLLAASIIVSFGLTRLLQSIPIITSRLQDIATGNLTTLPLSIHAKDELGTLSACANQMVENLHILVKQVAQSAEQVAASSQELTASADQSAQTVCQISNAIVDTAENAQQQLRAADQTLALVEDISSGIAQIANNATAATGLADQAAVAAQTGCCNIEKVVRQMNTIETTVNHSADEISQLHEASRQIGTIVETISAIANQTNLLALNATIEAARAGNQGRGFAVVAEEVRKLAEQSHAATKQIAVLITNIQAKAQNAVAAMNDGTREVELGSAVVREAGSAFNQISALVMQVDTSSQETLAAVNQMTESSRQIVKAMQQLDELSKSIAAQTQTAAAATEEQSASMEQMAEASRSLATLAQQLQGAITQFRI